MSDNILKPLLDNDLLTEESKEQIKEAWILEEKKIREEIETELREEFADRYMHDKGILMDAVERMVEDGLEAELAEFAQDRKALTDQRVKLANEIREARINSKEKLTEQTKMIETFILQNLKKEIGEFENDRNEVREAKMELAKELRESRVNYKAELAKRIQTLEAFVLGQLKTELVEFHDDKQALVTQRVKMIEEGRTKIEQTRKEFIKRSANLVETTIEEALQNELHQFRADIEASRKKSFGSEIFEAFAAEFKTSFFKGNKEIRDLTNKLAESEKKFSKATVLFEQSQKIAGESQKKQKLAENVAKRTSVMTELLSKISGKQRDVMAELLDGVKTSNLREAFKKYIPAVTNGTGTTALSDRLPNTLSERIVVTGNKKHAITESVEESTEAADVEIDDLMRLAGIH